MKQVTDSLGSTTLGVQRIISFYSEYGWWFIRQVIQSFHTEICNQSFVIHLIRVTDYFNCSVTSSISKVVYSDHSCMVFYILLVASIGRRYTETIQYSHFCISKSYNLNLNLQNDNNIYISSFTFTSRLTTVFSTCDIPSI